MKFEVLEQPGKEWDDFAAKHTDMLFFQSIWGSVLKEGLGAKSHYYCLIEKGRLVGGMPGIFLKYLNFRFFYSCLPYGGYIGEKQYAGIFFKELVSHLKSSNIGVDVACFLPSLFDAEQPDNERMVKKQTAITYIDLGSKTLEEIERGFNRGVRQSIRKAKKLKLRFEVFTDKGSMNIACSLYQESMKRNKGIVRYNKDWFDALHHLLIGKGLANVCVIFLDETPVCSVIPVHSGKGVHLLNNGSSTEHLGLRANDYMVYEIIKYCMERGAEYVDFMNSEPDDKNLIYWKEKFGSKTVYRCKYTLVNSYLKNVCWNTAKKIYPMFAS